MAGGTAATAVRKKLKVLHWKKVPNSKIPSSVWDGLCAAPPELMAREELELLFADEPKVSVKPRKDTKTDAKMSVLDLRRAQTVGIMLSRFKQPLDAVARAIVRMDARALTYDDVVAVRSYLPTEDEVALLEAFEAGGGDVAKLAPPDVHFWHLMRIPLLQRRMDAFAYLLAFDSRVRAVRGTIKAIQLACEEVLRSEELRFVLATVLGVGNTLNEGTFAGNARGFKIELLLRLNEVKSSDGKHDLLQHLSGRFHAEFPTPFALPAALAHAGSAAKENFLELDREIALINEGMDSINDLVLDAEQDSVLTGVLEAFRARTAEQPAALLSAMDSTKADFDRVASLLTEERSDAAPGDLFRVLHQFCLLLDRQRAVIIEREAAEEAARERRAKAAEKQRRQQQRRAAAAPSSRSAVPEARVERLRAKTQRKPEAVDMPEDAGQGGGREGGGPSTSDGQEWSQNHGGASVDEVIEVLSKHSKVAVQLLRQQSQDLAPSTPQGERRGAHDNAPMSQNSTKAFALAGTHYYQPESGNLQVGHERERDLTPSRASRQRCLALDGEGHTQLKPGAIEVCGQRLEPEIREVADQTCAPLTMPQGSDPADLQIVPLIGSGSLSKDGQAVVSPLPSGGGAGGSGPAQVSGQGCAGGECNEGMSFDIGSGADQLPQNEEGSGDESWHKCSVHSTPHKPGDETMDSCVASLDDLSSSPTPCDH